MSTPKSKDKLPSITKGTVELFSPSSLFKSPQDELLSSAKKLAAQKKNKIEMPIIDLEEPPKSVNTSSAIKPNKSVKLPPIEKTINESVLNIRQNLSSATGVSFPKLTSASHRSSSHNKHGGKRKTRKSKKGNKTRKVNSRRHRRSYKK
jgi:hypothetical protein